MMTHDSITTSCMYRNIHFRRMCISFVQRTGCTYEDILKDPQAVSCFCVTHIDRFLNSFKENVEGIVKLFTKAIEKSEFKSLKSLLQAFLALQRDPSNLKKQNDLILVKKQISDHNMKAFVGEIATDVEETETEIEGTNYMDNVFYLVQILKHLPALFKFNSDFSEAIKEAELLERYKLGDTFFRDFVNVVNVKSFGIKDADECEWVVIFCFMFMDIFKTEVTTHDTFRVFPFTIGHDDPLTLQSILIPSGDNSSSSSSSSSSPSALSASSRVTRKQTRASQEKEGILIYYLTMHHLI